MKQFANSTLPTLEKHLDRAKEIQQMLGGASPQGTSGRSSESSGSDSDKSKKTPGASGSTGSGTSRRSVADSSVKQAFRPCSRAPQP